jgi:hypothetical protein
VVHHTSTAILERTVGSISSRRALHRMVFKAGRLSNMVSFWDTPIDQERREAVKITFKTLVFIGSLWFMFSVDFVDQTSAKVVFLREAEAIVGAPLTPVSVAGVARRTTRRVVATEAAVATTTAAAASQQQAATAQQQAAVAQQQQATAQQQAAVAQQQAKPAGAPPIGTVVPALPAGCASVVVNGVSYSDCGGVFYKPAIQGNNLVYLVVEKPLK